jgi:hypothetical protein
VSNNTGGSFALLPARFRVDVAPPPNTPPEVSVTGVAHGASYEIGSVPTAGCSVDDAEDSNESTTPTLSAITGPLASYGLGSQSTTCSYTDGGGIKVERTATYSIVDTGKPVITDLGPTSSPDGANGWYISEVTNKFRATDSGAGFQTANPPLLQYDFEKKSGTAEGPSPTASAVKINSGSVSDVAGNAADAIDSAAFQIDLSNPELGITDNNSATYEFCGSSGPSRPSFNPSDAISGLDQAKTSDSWTTPNASSGASEYKYSAQAYDIAGRSASYGPKTYKVLYGDSVNNGSGAYGGVLQPINGGSTSDFSDDSSRFKLGSAVPVNFKLMCGTTPVDNAVAKLNVKKADCTPVPGVDEAISTAASTTGNQFRWDATNQQYIFNLSTKNGYTNPNGTSVSSWSAGTWTLSVLLDDGTYRSFNINLVK